MSNSNIRRILQGSAVAAALAIAVLAAPEAVTAQQPLDQPAQPQQQDPLQRQDLQRDRLQDQDLRQEPLGGQPYDMEGDDDDSSWGWLGLLGLAGLLGLRRRDRRDARPVDTTPRRP